MKRVKLFLVIGAMLLFTAGLLAGRVSRSFSPVTNLYYNDGSGTSNIHFHVVASSITSPILTDNPGLFGQVVLGNLATGTAYGLYEFSGSVYKPVYCTVF